MDKNADSSTQRRSWIPGFAVVFLFFLTLMTFLILRGYFVATTIKSFSKQGEVLLNPLMGFAPSADYPEAVGENTLVYLEVTFRELEPEQGKFDFAGLEEKNYLKRWRDEGKHVVLRFVCDIPGSKAHRDIPDWLYEQTADGTDYDTVYGKGYSPDYTNPDFRKALQRAVAALGEHYGKDHFVSYVEMGALGHWGEWHVLADSEIRPFPTEKICREYMQYFADAFPKARLLLRRPYALGIDFQAGLFNDMVGEEQSTREWLSWIQKGGAFLEGEEPLEYKANVSAWKSSPVGGEFTSSLDYEQMLTQEQNLEQTIALIQESHMSFIGPKVPILEERQSYEDGVRQILRYIGYLYRVDTCRIRQNLLTGKTRVELKVVNDGEAPLYFPDWKLRLYTMTKEAGLEPLDTHIDLTKISGNGASMTAVVTLPNRYYWGSELPPLYVGIEDPDTGQPAVALNMDTEHSGYLYRIN